MNIGHKIAELRDLHKLTQKELSDKLNLSQSAIAYYETNKKRPSIETLQLMAKIFNVNISYFLEEQSRTDTRNETTPEQKIKDALSGDPELSEFWESLSQREDLKILFKQTRDMSPEAIKRIIRYIKIVEDEEASEEF